MISRCTSLSEGDNSNCGMDLIRMHLGRGADGIVALRGGRVRSRRGEGGMRGGRER